MTFDRDPELRDPTIELAHEALIEEWPRYRGWIAEHRDALRAHRHLTIAAAAWANRGHDPSELYRGARLEVAESLLSDDAIAMSDNERGFVERSAMTQRDEIRDRATRSRRMRTAALVATVCAVLAIVAGAVAVVQRNRAETSARAADRRSVELLADRRSDEALDAIDEDPDLAILLALAGYVEAEGVPSRRGLVMSTLQTTLQSSRIIHREHRLEPDQAALHPDGDVLVIATPDGADVVQLDTGDRVGRVELGGPVGGLDYDDTGDRLAVSNFERGSENVSASGDFRLVVLDTASLEEVADLRADCCYIDARFDPGGRYVAARHVGGTATAVWDLQSPDADPVVHEGHLLAGWLGPSELLVLDQQGQVFVVDADSGTMQLRAWTIAEGVRSADLASGGERLAVLAGSGVVEVIDVANGESVQDIRVPSELVEPSGLRLTPDSSMLIIYGDGEVAEVHRLGSDERLTLRGLPNSVYAASASRDGSRAVVVGVDEVTAWDVSPAGPVELANIAPRAGPGTWHRVGAEPDTRLLPS